mmetsp:Transcript_296/g.545  ORF Transcript_296/g.545 Transcript_296/m.545 type:complete len:242 (+) Transcript_296:112-837(+)
MTGKFDGVADLDEDYDGNDDVSGIDVVGEENRKRSRDEIDAKDDGHANDEEKRRRLEIESSSEILVDVDDGEAGQDCYDDDECDQVEEEEELEEGAPVVREPLDIPGSDESDDGGDVATLNDVLGVRKMQELEYKQVAQFSDDHMKRYEAYRRADLKKQKIKKLSTALHPVLGQLQPSDPFMIGIKGLGKMFVGDVVESALAIQKKWNESGPLQPKHLREAYRKLQQDNILPVRKKDFSLM